MIKKTAFITYILAATLFLGLFSGQSYAQKLSPQAEISIITFGPGKDELYSSFGHSAIRVHDPRNGFDVAYNYGTFDFNQPHFYLNFAKGYLVYMLSVQDYSRLSAYYKYNNRSITEQLLRLSSSQKQIVFDYLQNNAKPENANYFYDYFYDNCATKIGDVFIESLPDEFKFDENFVEETGLTIRTLTDRYSAEYFPWGKLGIDLCLGMPMDKHLSNMQYTFLPDYVYQAFSMAQVMNNGSWRPVVISSNNIFAATEADDKVPFFTPKLVFWSVFLIIMALSVLAGKKGFSLRWLDFFLYFVLGLLGLFLFLLWVATDHAAAAWNLNLLWAWPSHLLVAFWLLRRRKPRWINSYLMVTAILGVLLVLSWAILPQVLNYSLIPIVLIITTRAVGIIME